MAVCWVILRGQQIYTVIQAVHSLLYIAVKCHFFSVVTWKDIIKYLQKWEGCTHFCEILYIYIYIYIYNFEFICFSFQNNGIFLFCLCCGYKWLSFHGMTHVISFQVRLQLTLKTNPKMCCIQMALIWQEDCWLWYLLLSYITELKLYGAEQS